MNTLSDNINAMFLFDDYKEQAHIRREQCMVVEKYDFSMHKSLKDNGDVYGGKVVGNILTITMSVDSAKQLVKFYSRTTDKESSFFSILFTVAFDNRNMLDKYTSSILAEGYIVSVEEDFKSQPDSGEQSMFITVKIMIKDLLFRNEELHTSCFI